MFAGLSAGCRDLRASADDYYDRQNLYDIRIQSTLGLTNADVKAVSQLKGVEKACGTYSETALVQAGDLQQKAEVTLLDMKDLTNPFYWKVHFRRVHQRLPFHKIIVSMPKKRSVTR